MWLLILGCPIQLYIYDHTTVWYPDNFPVDMHLLLFLAKEKLSRIMSSPTSQSNFLQRPTLALLLTWIPLTFHLVRTSTAHAPTRIHSPPLPPAPHFHPLEDNESNTLPSPCTRHRPAVEGKRNVISIPGLFMNPQSTQQCLKNAGVVSSLDIIKRHAEMQFDFREFRRHKGCQFNDNCISSSYSWEGHFDKLET